MIGNNFMSESAILKMYLVDPHNNVASKILSKFCKIINVQPKPNIDQKPVSFKTSSSQHKK